MGTMNSTHRPKLHGLNTYQRAELRKLTDEGWTIISVRRLQDDLNPWASVNMRSPSGQDFLTALPVSKREADYLSRVTG
jgi:hypothetical protein